MSTTIYVAVCEDRHIDPDISLHRSREAAIDYAKWFMKEAVANPEYLIEEWDGEHWHVTYVEEDRAYVVAAELE